VPTSTPADDPAGTLNVDAARAFCDARSLLFVCMGNICRSPFAERLARQQLPDDRRASSAGHFPHPGRRPPRPAVKAARRGFGVDLRGHRSRVLSPKMVEAADAVFVCDPHNHAAVTALCPEAAGRTHFLGALHPDGPLTVADPYGGAGSAYEIVYGQIARAIASAISSRS
jgi:protein-tyrosine-phosphatase